MPVAPLAAGALRWTAEVAAQDLAPGADKGTLLIGQERAEEAISFALALRRHGYHVYVSGPSGTGRTTYCRRRLKDAADGLPPAQDLIYLPNFDAPNRPHAVTATAGTAVPFEQGLRHLRQQIQVRLPQAFSSEEFAQARIALQERVDAANQADLHQLQVAAQALGCALEAGPTGMRVVPAKGGQPLAQAEIAALSEEELARLESHCAEVTARAQKFVRSAHDRQMQGQAEAQRLGEDLARFTCTPLFQSAREAVKEDALRQHLDALFDRIGEWLGLFASQTAPDAPKTRDRGWFDVNVFVARPEPTAPVVFEPNPTYYNLLGRIEYSGDEAGLHTDFTHIRPGALHRASGGYLILPAQALLSDRGAYEGLKRALLHREASVENIGHSERPVPVQDLDPEPFALDVQVVIVGPEQAYHQLRELDDQFRKLFKVRADFAPDMPNDPLHRGALLSFLGELSASREILPFAPDGAARMLEEAARIAGSQRRLSTRMAALLDLAVEADAEAKALGRPTIGRAHVQAALASRRDRFGQHEDRMLELIAEGAIRIETRGGRVGQVNGLTVLAAGEHAFGLPARITARTYAGEQGVIDIERQISLSGPIHSKGVYTLSGYLGWRFCRSRPLALSASLTIEQNYGGIEGDSASSTELYAILSDLADLPVRQEIAVTGSVDQNGRIQPIGGVNEKIEGFFSVCTALGLTGSQGCMIPRQNVGDLMLSEAVVEAAKDGRFHIYAVETIEEGITLLTQVPSGVEGDDHAYVRGSVYDRAAQRLSAYADAVDGRPGRRAPDDRLA